MNNENKKHGDSIKELFDLAFDYINFMRVMKRPEEEIDEVKKELEDFIRHLENLNKLYG